jgi:hypothetical protein
VTGPADRQVLRGGVAHAGQVVRIGDRVCRPAGPQTSTLHALLRHVRAAGFDGVPEPLGIDDQGLEWLGFIPGDVAYPPVPAWAQTDQVLASTAELLRRFHDATIGFVPPADATWDRELAPPTGGGIVGHHDVCLENVVVRHGRAVALLDFDFAAPSHRLADLATFARMCVPIDTPEDAAVLGRVPFGPFGRLARLADAYGLPPDRSELVDRLGADLARGGWFVQRRVDQGHPAFIAMWNQMDGAARYQRRQRWFDANRPRFLDALG